MDETESLSHTKWERKCHVFIPKCRRKRLYGEVRRAFGRAAAQVGGAERESNRRRAPAARSHAPDDCDTAEVWGVTSDRVCQREEGDSSDAGVGKEEQKLCGVSGRGRTGGRR